jgi:hypothetical protein
MNEATLKSALVKLVRYEHPDWLVFRHEDKFMSGLPDISVTGGMATSWWEVKFIRDGLSTKGVQESCWHRVLHHLFRNGRKEGNPDCETRRTRQVERLPRHSWF